MSDSLTPWLAKAVEKYRAQHKLDLSASCRGQLVQLTEVRSGPVALCIHIAGVEPLYSSSSITTATRTSPTMQVRMYGRTSMTSSGRHSSSSRLQLSMHSRGVFISTLLPIRTSTHGRAQCRPIIHDIQRRAHPDQITPLRNQHGIHR